MITVVLLVAAAFLFGGGSSVEAIRSYAASMRISGRALAASALVVAAIVAPYLQRSPAPTPAPPAPGQLDLRGLAIGPSAADDLIVFAGLCDELASCLEHDGGLPNPRIVTGAQLEELRIAARDGRMKGESIGARQPKLRAAIQKYLDDVAGTDGGPMTPAGRSVWVSAYRDIARAAEAATK